MRAPFTPTDEQRRQARDLAAAGLRQIDIAARLGVSRPTLIKYFSADLRASAPPAPPPSTEPTLFTAPPTQPQPPPPSPDPQPAPRGRPRYMPTRADRDRVQLLVASGWTVAQIARTLGVSEPTASRAYAEEIETGALRKRAENLARMDAAAKRGNVTAQRALEELFGSVELARLAPQSAAEPRKPKEEPIGKKIADQHAAAETMRTGAWADVLHRPN